MTAMQHHNWFVLAVFAMLCFVVTALIIKQLTLIEPQTESINFYFCFATTVVFLLFSLLKGTRLVISSGSIKWFTLLAIIAAAANYFSVSAIRLAPNPGYVTGVRAFETLIIGVLAVFVFGSEITATKMIGIVLSVSGLIMLSR